MKILNYFAIIGCSETIWRWRLWRFR